MNKKKIGLVLLILILVLGCQSSNQINNKENGIIIDDKNSIYYVIRVESKYDFMQNFKIKNFKEYGEEYTISGIESHSKNQYNFIFYVYHNVFDGILAYEPNKNLCHFTKTKIESEVFANFAAFHIESVTPMSFRQFKEKLENK